MTEIQTLTTPNAVQDVRRQEVSFLAVEIQNGTATVENGYTVSYKNEHILTIRSNHHTPWYLPK